MAIHNEIGVKGEELAVEFLSQLGYEIISTNWKKRKYELDIIAKDKDEIVFVEVKTRSSAIHENPEEAVDDFKQKHLVDGANHFLENYHEELEARFDVLSIILTTPPEIKHFKSAFIPEW